MTMQERIEIRMHELGLNANSLAKKMRRQQSTLHSLLSGRTKTFRDLPLLAEALETTPQWLLTGQHEIQKTSPNNEILIEAILKAAINEKESPAQKLIDIAKKDLKSWLKQDEESGNKSSVDQLIRVVRMRLDKK